MRSASDDAPFRTADRIVRSLTALHTQTYIGSQVRLP